MSGFEIQYNAGQGWRDYSGKITKTKAVKLAEQLSNRSEIGWAYRVVNKAKQQVWPEKEETK